MILRATAIQIAATTLFAGLLLLGCGGGCGEVIEENKDLQMDRRQTDTYADEPLTEPQDHTVLEPAGEAD